jgi:hypothetical protein
MDQHIFDRANKLVKLLQKIHSSMLVNEINHIAKHKNELGDRLVAALTLAIAALAGDLVKALDNFKRGKSQ